MEAYNTGINLQEAEKRYKGVKEKFKKVKSRYSGPISRFKKNLGKKDNKTLSDCIGVLMPLTLEDSVQEQIKTTDIKDSLFNQITELQYEILDYLANFKNTGVKRLEGNLDL